MDVVVPSGYRKIAQNDSAMGVVVAAIYFRKESNQYLVVVQKDNNEQVEHEIIGPIGAFAFESLAHIMADVHGMERKYYYLD